MAATSRESECAVQTLTAKGNAAAAAEDIGNIVSLEHVNVRIDDQLLATHFYIIGLGFTRDPYMNVGLTNMWINIGDQQFHLPTGKPQVLRGHTGLVVPDLTALKDRLKSIEDQLSGTRFAWSDKGEYVEARSPWGNEYRCYPAGSHGAMKLGVPYVELTVPVGSAAGIQRFYTEVFGAPSTREDGLTEVEVGVGQRLRFRETDQVPEYDGHHIAVYIANFSGPFEYLEERGLVTEGIRNHQFRFKDIVDPETGQTVFVLEHEVRSSRHPGFRRPLVNRGEPPF
jgi:catechol-2,3-dioxygenase